MMKRLPQLSVLTILAVVALCGGGCSNVKPWERSTLADYTMRGDRDPIAAKDNEHMWFSRESASGGKGVGGGGCGCN